MCESTLKALKDRENLGACREIEYTIYPRMETSWIIKIKGIDMPVIQEYVLPS